MATATRNGKVAQAQLAELLDIELEEASLKAKLKDVEKRWETVNAELLRLLVDKKADIERGALYAIVKETPGRANVPWAKVCERELGVDFCNAERAKAERSEAVRKVQVLKR